MTANHETIVKNLLDRDPFSKWLGIQIEQVNPGYVILRLRVRKDMLNGFRVCHGGIPFALADSALAFASNSRGNISVTLTSNISFLRKINEGDVLKATADEVRSTRRTGIYEIFITREDDITVASFRGTVYRSNRNISESLNID